MGMTIEDTISDLTELKICGVVPFTKGTISGGNYKVITEECLDTAIDTMRKYQKLQADHETRLKADMVAMLTEIQLDIEECVDGGEGSPQFEQGVDIARCQVVDIIQQKINELKAEIEPQESEEA